MATGGYDYNFITGIPDCLVCKICQLASRDPHLSVCCGHTFCKSCVDKVKKSDNSACPMCRNKEFSSFRNLEKDREVKGLTVSCSNFQEGCTWKGEIRELQSHGRTCPYEMVHCQYHNIGCENKVQRRELKRHNKENAEEHLELSVAKLKNLEHLVHQLTMKNVIRGNPIGGNWSALLNKLSVMMATSGDQVCPVIVKVPEFNSKKLDEVWYSNSFYSHDKGYKMCWKIYPAGAGAGRGTHISVSLCLMKGQHDDELIWPLKGKFEVKLLNQITDCEHYSVTVTYDDNTEEDTGGRVTDGGKSRGWGRIQFATKQDLHKVTPTCQYLREDCIFLQVSKLEA